VSINVQQVIQIGELLVAVEPVAKEFWTTLYSTIQGVEAAFPGSPGKDKLNAVITQLVAVFGAVASNAEPLVNGAVSFYNAIGAFKHSTAPTAATPAVIA
jgi:hypothetical protein